MAAFVDIRVKARCCQDRSGCRRLHQRTSAVALCGLENLQVEEFRTGPHGGNRRKRPSNMNSGTVIHPLVSLGLKTHSTPQCRCSRDAGTLDANGSLIRDIGFRPTP